MQKRKLRVTFDDAQMAQLPSSRALALAAENDYYFTGKPCKNGHIDVRRASGGHCMTCARDTANAGRARDPLKIKLDNLASANRREGRPFDRAAYEEVWLAMPTHCPIMGIKLECSSTGIHPAQPEMDRIVPELGYVRGNMWVICRRANTIKNDATPGELRLIADAVEAKMKGDRYA